MPAGRFITPGIPAATGGGMTAIGVCVTGFFHDEPGAGRDNLLGCGAAIRTYNRSVFIRILQYLKIITAVCTFILVKRHIRSMFNLL